MPPPNTIAGTAESLVVIDPPKADWDIWRGTTKELTYILRNTSYHVIKNVTFKAMTYIKSKEQGDIGTIKNYAEVGHVPDRINPNSEIEVVVTVTIPQNYNEVIKYEGKMIEYPFRVSAKALGIKSIEEI